MSDDEFQEEKNIWFPNDEFENEKKMDPFLKTEVVKDLWSLVRGETLELCEKLVNENSCMESTLQDVARFGSNALVDRYANLLDGDNWYQISECIDAVYKLADLTAMEKTANIIENHDVTNYITNIAVKFPQSIRYRKVITFLDSNEHIENYAPVFSRLVSTEGNRFEHYLDIFQTDVLGEYSPDKRNEVLRSISFIKPSEYSGSLLSKAITLYSKPELKEMIEQCEGFAASKIIEIYAKWEKEDFPLKVARMCMKYKQKVAAATLVNRRVGKGNDETLNNLVNCLDKYAKIPEVVLVLERTEDSAIKADYEEILSKDAYESILHSGNREKTIKDILFEGYTYLREKIGVKCSYSDLQLVKKTQKMISEIHKERNETDCSNIINEFYSEMNRAINQSSNYRGKIRNLRRYCHEVSQQMRDNASELMVVHNA